MGAATGVGLRTGAAAGVFTGAVGGTWVGSAEGASFGCCNNVSLAQCSSESEEFSVCARISNESNVAPEKQTSMFQMKNEKLYQLTAPYTLTDNSKNSKKDKMNALYRAMMMIVAVGMFYENVIISGCRPNPLNLVERTSNLFMIRAKIWTRTFWHRSK